MRRLIILFSFLTFLSFKTLAAVFVVTGNANNSLAAVIKKAPPFKSGTAEPEFTNAPADVKITPACNGQNGSVKGLTVSGATTYTWHNETGAVVANTLDLTNAIPGKYQLMISDGVITKSSDTYEIQDIINQADVNEMVITPSLCNQNTGSLKGIKATAGAIITWSDGAGKTRGTSLDLLNVEAGAYTLIVTSANGVCTQNYGPYQIANPVVTAPVLNEYTKIITSTLCGQSAGSITGITATGNGPLTYSWKNQFGGVVSTSLNLNNKTGGKYRLTVTDATGCGVAVSTEIEIPELNSVSLITTNGKAISASCEKANGSIIGLQAVGAIQLSWARKTDNVVVGNIIDLKNVVAGDYVLTLKNAICSKSYDFRINALASSAFADISVTVTNTCFAFVTGKITVNADNAVEKPAAYRWVNSAGNNAAFGPNAQFLAEGKYKLYLTNKYGCENLYNEYTVGKFPPLVNAVYGTITHIICGLGRGSVSTTTFTGGTGNYVYQWYGPDGAPLPGKTEPFINNLSPGTYTLKATDGGCSLSEIPYTIRDNNQTQAPPTVADIDLPKAGIATIKVTDPYTTALYRLYDSETATTPVDERRGGTFNVSVAKSQSFWVTLTYGYCESARVKINVLVNPSASTIANTFTPNGDGVNDFWKIADIESFGNSAITVFNRSGKAVFQSKGYAVPFDGNYQGKALPVGVYYYSIDLKNGTVVSGNLTIIR